MRDIVRVTATIAAMRADPIMGHTSEAIDLHERYLRRKSSGKNRSKVKAARKQRSKKGSDE
jgi:hypothetical protein